MKNILRLLVCVGALATPQLLSADESDRSTRTCTHAYGDCNDPNISASDVEVCWYNDAGGNGLMTIYWCNGDITYRLLSGGSSGKDYLHMKQYNNTGRN